MKKIFFVFALLSLGACKSIMDKKDLNSVGLEIWNNPSEANLYMNKLYASCMPTWPENAGATYLPNNIHNTSDESNTANSDILYGRVTSDEITDFGSNTTAGASTYVNIRNLNSLIVNIDAGTMDEVNKRFIKAQAYFFRGYLYFEMVKQYGGVPYLSSPEDWQKDNLFIPRTPTSDCIDSISRDLDSAAAGLNPDLLAIQGADRGRLTRGAAMGLKGRMLLYFASQQFNPTNDITKWQRAYAANEAAYNELKKDGYALFPSFSNVLLDKSTANTEVIIVREMDGNQTNGTYNSFENKARASSEGSGGGYQPTWDLVQAFPMANGLPVTAAGSGYDSVYYWQNRDPRFAATIVWNGSIWPLSNKANRRQWTYTGTSSEPTLSQTGFYCRKGVNTTTPQSLAAYGTTDWVEMRLAEVMLNLAECAVETGNQSEAMSLMVLIRQRAGITPGTNNLYGLNATLTQMDIINERRIELAFEGKRYDDLRRTKLWTSLNGTYRHKLVITANAANGITIDTLNKVYANGSVLRDTIVIDGPSYKRLFTASVQNLDNTSTPINFLSSYYFYPINPSYIQRDNNMLQTNTWGGSFDPLK